MGKISHKQNQSAHLLETLDNTTPNNLDTEELGTYDDFHTIDWLREMSRNRLRHRQIQHKKNESYFHRIKKLHDAWSGWLVVLLVGLAAGKLKLYVCSLFVYIFQKYNISNLLVVSS